MTPIVRGPEPTWLLSLGQGRDMPFPLAPSSKLRPGGRGGGTGTLARTGLSPTGSAGQMDALRRGVRADALIWADVLAQQLLLPRGHLEKHNKGDGEEEEEEEGDAFILFGSPSSFPKGWFKGSVVGTSRGRGGQARSLSCLPKGWGHPLHPPALKAACLEGAART